MDRLPDHELHGLQQQIDGAMKSKAPIRMTEQLGEVVSVCEQHGTYQSSGVRYFGKREVWSKCPDCHEVELAAERQREAQERAQANLARIETMLDEAAIPRRFLGRSFDNFHTETDAQRAVLAVMRDYAENFAENEKLGKGLVLAGGPGAGKTHLTSAVQQFLMPAASSLYVTALGVIRAVRNTWRKDSERSETEVLAMLGSVQLLVLDEVGVQYGTDGEQTILFDVIDKRYRDMRPTIVLTNQGKRGLKEFIGERSFDRIAETATWVPLDWPSYRPTAKLAAANSSTGGQP